ncbi:MAG: DUF349 domain-containing protein [Bacteroidales bacterium]|nr:DUF349 domain-containing protein [Bacteroidales bacterium]
MEKQNLNDQNPEKSEMMIQEEKSTTAKKTVKKKAVKVPKQVDEELRNTIVERFSDGIKDKNDEPEKPTPVLPQISEEERNVIIRMFMDTQAALSMDNTVYEDIDYDHLNKQELVEMLEEIVEEKDVSKIKQQVSFIKGAFYRRNKEDIESKRQDFIAEGGNADDFQSIPDPLEIRFNNAFSVYRHNKAKFTEELEKQKQSNLAEKYKILDELRELINSEETLKKTYDQFQELQEKWKSIGIVPIAENNNLWQNYHFLVERFFDKVRINKELRDLDLKKNLEQKIELCEKAEELLQAEPTYRTFKLLQKYHDEWREIGPVPRENNEEIWERFKKASDQINQQRRDHYKGLQEDQKQNYELKKGLCEQIETLVSDIDFSSIKSVEKYSDKIAELIKTWKTIGRAPKAQNDEIWDRFKSSLDAFYQKKRDFFADLKKQQMENYNAKVRLCERAEAIQDSTSWRITTDELIGLQKEWKSIGPVPRKFSDKIWKRFRAACDIFFNNKAAFYKSRKEDEEDNLKKKEAIIDEMIHFVSKATKEENMAAVRELRKRWDEIGHVVYKEKDKIQNKYRESYNELLKKLSIASGEVANSQFRQKLETFKNSGQGEQQILKERSHLYAKIKKLKEEIILWENNIGFFSDSKQSNALKTEFEKKIAKAKTELKSLNDKLRLIDQELG